MNDKEFRNHCVNDYKNNWPRFWAFGAFGVGIAFLILSKM